MSELAFHWKMLFNLNPSKQAIEICFSHTRDNVNYPSLVFNDMKVQLATSHKHLGLILEHLDNKPNKCNKIIGIMKRLSSILANNIQILRQA